MVRKLDPNLDKKMDRSSSLLLPSKPTSSNQSGIQKSTNSISLSKHASFAVSTKLYIFILFLACLGDALFSHSLVQANEGKEGGKPEIKTPLDYDYVDYGMRDDALRPKFRSRHFTPIIGPKEELCLFVTLKKDDTLTVTMQVLRGGDNKIWLVLRNFQDKKHIDPKPPSKNAYRTFKTPEDGQYEVCLNNKFNFAHTKVVSIDLAISKELTSHEDYEDDEEGGEPPAPSPSEQTEGDDPFQKSDQDEFDTIKKVETMLHIVKWIQTNVGRGRFAFMKFKGQMMKDAYYKQDQLQWVNIWSGMVCGSLVIVYLIEVHLIKRMFQNNSKTSVLNKTGMKMGL